MYIRLKKSHAGKTDHSQKCPACRTPGLARHRPRDCAARRHLHDVGSQGRTVVAYSLQSGLSPPGTEGVDVQTAVLKKRIWGWFFFDWASQPYHTLLVTFIFGPYFAAVATQHFMGTGLPEDAADARAQSLWSLGLTVSGLVVGLGAPILGALADAAGRRMTWIIVFSALCVLGAGSLWWVMPDGSNLAFGIIAFGIGFIGVEFALIFTNAAASLARTVEGHRKDLGLRIRLRIYRRADLARHHACAVSRGGVGDHDPRPCASLRP